MFNNLEYQTEIVPLIWNLKPDVIFHKITLLESWILAGCCLVDTYIL